MSLHIKMSNLAESFACRVYKLHVEIMKQLQASNEQYKFQSGLHKYHDILNVRDYFMIYTILEQYPLESSQKL